MCSGNHPTFCQKYIDELFNLNIIESCFKALARALRQATEIDPRGDGRIPSTKGVLGGSL